jgi:hypothetical protein
VISQIVFKAAIKIGTLTKLPCPKRLSAIFNKELDVAAKCRWIRECRLSQDFAVEGHAAGDHLVEDNAQRIDVRAGVRLPALDLLGTHVLGGADDDALPRHRLGAERVGDTEVHDAGVPVPVDDDVRGLEVAVDNSQSMGLGQSIANLRGARHGLGGRQLAGLRDEAAEVLPGTNSMVMKWRPRSSRSS